MASGGESSNELAKDLYKLAKEHLGAQSWPERPTNKGNVLYRNKTVAYFNDIIQDEGGVMSPYMKDDNGDRSNPMNGKREGLFFMANMTNCEVMTPPNRSPFGPRRLSIPIAFLLGNFNQNGWELFFNDFFCMTKTGPHYVTLVICEKDSENYEFCMENLMLLPAEDNPFFMIVDDGNPFLVHTKIWVEVFYMKEININHAERSGAKFTTVEWTGTSESRKGIQKPSDCAICNRRKQLE